MKTIIIFLLGFLLGVIFGSTSYAGSLTQGFSTICGERGAVIKHLEKTYSEAPVSMGLGSNGAVIEILASPKGSWTIILTRPDGTSCVMAAGESWENVAPELKGPKI